MQLKYRKNQFLPQDNAFIMIFFGNVFKGLKFFETLDDKILAKIDQNQVFGQNIEISHF